MKFGIFVRNKRASAGITLRDATKVTGISCSRLSEIERSIAAVAPTQAEMLAMQHAYSISDFSCDAYSFDKRAHDQDIEEIAQFKTASELELLALGIFRCRTHRD
jgi:transcriptional regulator with XRE-family HTH domain